MACSPSPLITRTEAHRNRWEDPARFSSAHRRSIAFAHGQRWSVENHLTLGQVATHAKSNEITAIPELLKLLDLEGAVVTIDAMGCQKDIAAGIVEQKCEYVLAVKENQPHLYEDIEQVFEEALDQGKPGVDFTKFVTEGARSGRKETRTCCVITNPSRIRNMGLWTKLTAICMVVSQSEANGISSSEIRYFIGSVDTTAEQYLGWVRGHWGIENTLHWVVGRLFPRGRATLLGWKQSRKTYPGCANWRCAYSRQRRIAKERVFTAAVSWRDGKTSILLSVLAQIPEKSGA